MSDQPSQNNSNNEKSLLDPGQIARDIHISEDNAIKIIKANSLIPREFSRVQLDYVPAGKAKGEISRATYHDTGIKQVTSFFPRGDQQPSPEIASIALFGSLASTLSQTYFLLEDPAGRVGVFYALDGDLTIPSTGAARNIKVDILTGDTDTVITTKTRTALNSDIEFIATSLNTFVTVTSSTNGNKINAVDVNTGFEIETIDGKESLALDNTYFNLYSPTVIYYVWYNVDGTGVNPAPAGQSGIEVAITSDSDIDIVAQTTIQALNETRYFTATRNGIALIVTTNEAGETTDSADVNTGFTHFKTIIDGVNIKIIRTVDLTYNTDGELDTAVGY